MRSDHAHPDKEPSLKGRLTCSEPKTYIPANNMQINFQFVPDRSIKRLWERFYEAAEAHGIGRDEALRQALTQWLISLGSGVPASTLTITEKEFAWIRATLDVLRETKTPE
jgi:hypothetical protein